MVTNGVAAAAVAAPAGGPSALGLAGSALYGAYGLRLTSFLLRRQSDAAYKPKWDSVQEKSDKMGPCGRLGVVTFVSLTQAAYALPITNAMKSSPAPDSGGGRAARVGWVGVGLAAAGLLLEHLADEEKLAAKRADPSAPVTTGLFSYCRHPNYSGEILFHLGICGLAAQGDSLVAIGLGMLSPLMLIGVMFGAAKRLDKEGAEKYAADEKWQEWAERTPSLWPRLS